MEAKFILLLLFPSSGAPSGINYQSQRMTELRNYFYSQYFSSESVQCDESFSVFLCCTKDSLYFY